MGKEEVKLWEIIEDKFPHCEACGNKYRFDVTLENKRYGRIWDDVIIPDIERALYLGDEYDELADIKVEAIWCVECGKRIFPKKVKE